MTYLEEDFYTALGLQESSGSYTWSTPISESMLKVNPRPVLRHR